VYVKKFLHRESIIIITVFHALVVMETILIYTDSKRRDLLIPGKFGFLSSHEPQSLSHHMIRGKSEFFK